MPAAVLLPGAVRSDSSLTAPGSAPAASVSVAAILASPGAARLSARTPSPELHFSLGGIGSGSAAPSHSPGPSRRMSSSSTRHDSGSGPAFHIDLEPAADGSSAATSSSTTVSSASASSSSASASTQSAPTVVS
jgi:hypothetical protein